jgi:hypothetical protein
MLTALTIAALECPAGAAQSERQTAEAREVWCQRPDGTRDGPRHAWYKDGARWFEGVHASGSRAGTWTFWYPSGAKQSEAEYQDDKASGPQRRWHDNGALALSGKCLAGREVGTWERWSASGKLELSVHFEGPSTRAAYYSRRGLPVSEMEWLQERVRGQDPARLAQARTQFAIGALFRSCRD